MAISIHVPHTRDDIAVQPLQQVCIDFNPRPSHEGRPERQKKAVDVVGISIHVPHTRDDQYEDATGYIHYISIHVPHTRDDLVIGMLR